MGLGNTYLEYVSLSRYVMQLPSFMLGTEYDNVVAKYLLSGENDVL